MDLSEQEEVILKNEIDRFKERSGFWNPPKGERQKQYLVWLKKQADQRQKTLELDGVTHSRQRKELLRRQKKAFMEEYKRIKDLIEDGR